MKEGLYYLFISGLILGSGPCVSFCGPILAGYVSVYKASFKKAVFSYLVFSAAKISSYIILGGLCGIFSGILKSGFLKYLGIINIVLGAFILLIGILTVISKEPLADKYCSFLHKGNIRNTGLLGFLVGFSPCLPLLGILNYIIIISHSPFEAAIFAAVFGLGTAVSPLVLLIALSGKLAGQFSGNRKLQKIIRLGSGVVLAFLGVKIFLRTPLP